MKSTVPSRLGVDVGGTFTDLVFYDDATGEIRVGKGSTVPASPDIGVRDVVSATLRTGELSGSDLFLHGTTVGINAVVERKGAVVGVLTTDGFRDVLETRRTDREEFYNMLWKAPSPLVRRSLRLPVRERVRADGSVHRDLEAADVGQAAEAFLQAGVEAIAVVFINSHANPAHELEAERLLREAGFEGEISLSHQVTGEFREYERTATTVIDAYVRPRVSRYLGDLRRALEREGFAGEYLVTRSGGGSMPFAEAELRPFETVMSGPVAGAVGSAELCRQLNIPLAVTADVGGTTFDTCLILDHQPQVKYEGQVAGMPLQTTWVDVRSIGAGGGSIAFEDGGLLHVGARSAGADPGPVCYGRGGTEPTVTDAAATLGMLAFGQLAGGVHLDIDAARNAVDRLGEAIGLDVDRTAQGVMEIAATTMANSIRAILEEVGEDPREAQLLTFGGAGPLFGTLLARELDIRTIAVPNYAGNFSAWGLLLQDLSRAAARTVVAPLTQSGLSEASRVVRDLHDELARRSTSTHPSLGSEARFTVGLDLRYQGQEYFLTVEVPFANGAIDVDQEAVKASFQRDYEKRYGHTLHSGIEIVAARLTSTTPLPRTNLLSAPPTLDEPGERRTLDAFSFTAGMRVPFDVVDRSALAPGATAVGPAIVVEETATTYVDVGFAIDVHPSGTLLIHEGREGP
jgi:N-methylhydantoinase A